MENRPRMSRFWTCSISTCSNAAAIDIGGCEHCTKNYCTEHAAHHGCSEAPLDDAAWKGAQVRELQSLRAKINDEALMKRASGLNQGMPCRLDETDFLGESRMGGMHIHLRLIFADHSAWLVRVLRQNYTSFDDGLSNDIFLSECATLKWLETIDYPAPRLYDYGLRNDPSNSVGVAFMLISEIPGNPLNQLDTSEAQLSKVYSQLADLHIRLSKHSFDRIGSLTLDANGNISIGPITGDRTGTLSYLGPFANGREYYSAWSREYMRLIVDGQMFSQYPVNAYLIFKHLEQLALDGKCNQFEAELDDGPFYLKHTDDKGDHIFVDDDYNITGIIDWSFARTVPMYEAFGPSLVTARMGDIFRGTTGLSEQDGYLSEALKAKRSRLARFAQSSDTARRFIFGLGMGMSMSGVEALGLFNGILAALGEEPIADWQKWRENAISRCANDDKAASTIRSLIQKEL
ncbi:unnamed protein product [Periconia digitata]|uniref:Aminoglycoside phosphotransferase domain-containing protein n=1 Tax=Periconia digitata TaxID=1303443 RepID=A0A9W4UCE6_9PLEO|nr:unnamed protein product [Periconia digitata]